jgi:hypothetical protein|tara:strand:- start:211 stop:459 length:249 start_codon:yes stop_codon:yes gene_type:complete
VETLKKYLEKLTKFWYWLKSWFITYHELTVSYNATWGDADDTKYIVSKFYKKQPNYIKFKTQEGEMVEIRGADGLNYKIFEL